MPSASYFSKNMISFGGHIADQPSGEKLTGSNVCSGAQWRATLYLHRYILKSLSTIFKLNLCRLIKSWCSYKVLNCVDRRVIPYIRSRGLAHKYQMIGKKIKIDSIWQKRVSEMNFLILLTARHHKATRPNYEVLNFIKLLSHHKMTFACPHKMGGARRLMM